MLKLLYICTTHYVQRWIKESSKIEKSIAVQSNLITKYSASNSIVKRCYSSDAELIDKQKERSIRQRL